MRLAEAIRRCDHASLLDQDNEPEVESFALLLEGLLENPVSIYNVIFVHLGGRLRRLAG